LCESQGREELRAFMQATVVCFGSKQLQYQYYSRGMELASSVSGSRLRVQSLLPQQSKDNTLTVSAFCCFLQTVYNLRSHCSCTWYSSSLRILLQLMLFFLFLLGWSSICVKNEEGGFVESWFFPLPPALELHCVA
jgi:hypothetical protein